MMNAPGPRALHASAFLQGFRSAILDTTVQLAERQGDVACLPVRRRGMAQPVFAEPHLGRYADHTAAAASDALRAPARERPRGPVVDLDVELHPPVRAGR